MNLELLGDFIREARLNRGYSLRDLAARSGLSPAQVSNLERGRVKNPSDATLEKVAEALNVPKEEFFLLAGRAYGSYGIIEVSKNLQDSMQRLTEVSVELVEAIKMILNEENLEAAISSLLLHRTPTLSGDEAKEVAREMEAAYRLWEKKKKVMRKNREARG